MNDDTKDDIATPTVTDTTQTVPETITDVVIENVGWISVPKTPTRPLENNEFFIRTLYSGISAGTELTFFLGTNPKGTEGWDAERRLFRGDLEPDLEDVFPKHEGYMEVGEVIVSRNKDYPVGMRVAGVYHHTDGYIASGNDFLVPLPDGLDPLLGIWVAKMGPISLNGILYAADEIRRQALDTLDGSLADQRVIVMGAGMIGLLCGVFAQWAGAKEVVIVDSIQERLDAAEKLGMVPMTAQPTLPIEIKDRWTSKDTSDSGADIVLQCTGSDYLLHEAFSCLREQGTVIDLGFYQQGANQVFLGHEFHHNRLRHICAQIGAVPRAQAAGWDRMRLSKEVISFLQENGTLLKDTLVSHVVPFGQAQEVFEKLAARDHSLLQVVLQPEAAE